MISRAFLALAVAVATASPTEMREVRIASEGTETEITVVVGGPATPRHMMLTNPPRLLLDINGVNRGLARRHYDRIDRGGVLGMRSTQFRPGTVRLVFDLDRETAYRVTGDSGAVRVSFQNPGPPFAPWSTTDARGAAATDVRGASAPLPAVQETEPRISVVYDSASMLDVLAGFSEFADISVVPNGEVASVVVRGIDIRDQPWDVALNAILSAQNLGWHRTESGIIVVDWLENLQARDQLLSETRVIRVNYARADSVAETLRHLATPDRGQVVSFSSSNTVIVTDAPSVVARMDTIIAALDRRLPQVAIEAKIVFVDRTDVQQLGIVYDLKERNGGFVEQGLNDLIAAPDPDQPPQLVPLSAHLVVIAGFVGVGASAPAD